MSALYAPLFTTDQLSNAHGRLQAKGEVQKLIVKAQDGALEAQPGRTIMESFEGQVHLSMPAFQVPQLQCLTHRLAFKVVLHIASALMYSRDQTGLWQMS